MIDSLLILAMFTFGFRIQELFSIIYIILNMNFKGYSKKNIFIFLILLIINIFILIKNEISFLKALQQLIVIFPIYLSYKMLFEKKSIELIMGLYIKVSKIVIYLGFFQFLIFQVFKINMFEFILGVTYTKSGFLSINSISGEPGMFAQLILPSTIYTIEEDWFKNGKFSIRIIIFILAITLTNTAIGYFILGAYLIVRFILSKVSLYKKIVLSTVLITLIALVLNYDEMVYMKITESLNILYYLDDENLKKANLSTYALYSNLKAFLNSKNYLLGNGFGSIEHTYYKYFKDIGYSHYGLNSTDGYSLINRILSEFGILGIIFFYGKILLETMKIIKYKRNISISVAALFGIISYSIRGGSYFMHGIIFFILLLIYSNKKER